MFARFNQLTGWTKFGLLWNALFFLFECTFVVLLHSLLPLLFALMFAAFFFFAWKDAQREWAIHDAVAEQKAKVDSST